MVLLNMIKDPGVNSLETNKCAINFYPGLKAVIASGFQNLILSGNPVGDGEYLKKPYTYKMELRAKAIIRGLDCSKKHT
jgi:hypothetical protein